MLGQNVMRVVVRRSPQFWTAIASPTVTFPVRRRPARDSVRHLLSTKDSPDESSPRAPASPDSERL